MLSTVLKAKAEEISFYNKPLCFNKLQYKLNIALAK